MIVSHLKIERFRNLAQVEIALARGVTLLWGHNAQGKTNLPEAIYYLATGRSFRTRQDHDCLSWEAATPAVARMIGATRTLEVRQGRMNDEL